MSNLRNTFHLHPTPARWFETYVPRTQSVYALDVLAKTGLVELEVDPRYASPLIVDEVRDDINQFDQLCDRYGNDFPSTDADSFHISEPPEQSSHHSIPTLRNYCAKIATLRRKENHSRKALNNFSLLYECLIGLDCTTDIFEQLSHKSEFLYKAVFAHPNSVPFNPELGEAIQIRVTSKGHDFFIVAALSDHKEDIDNIFSKSQKIEIPGWLAGDCREQINLVEKHIEQLKINISGVEWELSVLNNDDRLAGTIANLNILKWFLESAPKLTRKQKLCHLTGWTTAEQSSELQNALKKAEIAATVRFTETPEGVKPPVMEYQSPWSVPFRMFVDMLGTPGRQEVDPTFLLPIIVPLLFGFMFPDVGHGLILILAGLAFRSKPELRILVPCGLYAIAFGFLFGDFFGSHDVIDALWFYPMDDPITILVTCMVFGFSLILLSIVFSGIEAYWKGNLRK